LPEYKQNRGEKREKMSNQQLSPEEQAQVDEFELEAKNMLEK
jgi:hypothetical protein